ncbi:MAG: hypothetical protein CM15mP49_04850 [Actinomycetota bacterium]|nr:MAG: hypothetical protein CM15mP49_04850 [Actinomycetota bacterium]
MFHLMQLSDFTLCMKEFGTGMVILLFGASLDHAVWFHRSSSPYNWHLHLHEGINHINNRGLASGKIYSLTGSHVATVVQEILQRRSR